MKELFTPICDDKNISVIFDTDIGGDCDDTGALALLVYYCRKYGTKLLGVINDTDNPYGTYAVDGILNYLGMPVPLGQCDEKGFFDETNPGNIKYNKFVSENFSPLYKEGTKVPTALEMYEKLLTSAEDNSVVIIGVGFLNTINEAFCKLPELFLKKVKYIVSMAGDFSGSYKPEWNVLNYVSAAKNLTENCPKPIIFCGFEIGENVITGFEDKDYTNPINASYWLFNQENQGVRNSWDLCTVQFAFEGCGKLYSLSNECKITVEEDGAFKWEFKEGKRQYIKLNAKETEIATEINKILKEMSL